MATLIKHRGVLPKEHDLIFEEAPNYLSRFDVGVVRGAGRLPAGMVMGRYNHGGPYLPSPQNAFDDQPWLTRGRDSMVETAAGVLGLISTHSMTVRPGRKKIGRGRGSARCEGQ
jgi:hypothetical protein